MDDVSRRMDKKIPEKKNQIMKKIFGIKWMIIIVNSSKA